MFRALTVILMSALLALSGLALSAKAQSEAQSEALSEAEAVNAFGVWSAAVTELVNEAIGLTEQAAQADEIALAYTAGDISRSDAEAQLDDWRMRVDAQYQALSTRAEALVKAPPRYTALLSQQVDAIIEVPANALTAVADFLEESERYNRAVLAGQNPDINTSVIAQFGVLQIFNESMIVQNTAARGAMNDNHPQYFLLEAFITNLRSTQLLMEASRQALGAAPSQYAVGDLSAAISQNERAVSRIVQNGRVAQQAMLETLEAGTPAQLGVTEQQRRVAIQMIQTYTASFDNELEGAAIHVRNVDLVDAAPGGGLAYNVFDDAFVAYERLRDRYQLERQRLAANF
jgi:hypothetical protein